MAAARLVIPFVLYVVGTAFVARLDDRLYPLAYSVLVVVGCLVSFALLRGKKILQPHWRVAPAVVFGLLGIGLWIALCHLGLERRVLAALPAFLNPGERVGYNPFAELGAGWPVWSFIAMRLLGIAVLVPIAEEIFWRGFLTRWLIDPEWERVEVGEYTLHSCAIVVALFTLAHPAGEWLAAATYGGLIQMLYYWKKDLWLCVVAHAVSNFVLAVYVLATGVWWLW